MKIRFIAAVAALLLMPGCLATAQPVRPQIRAVSALVPGQTTAQEAIALMGKPYSVTAMGALGELVQWMQPTPRSLAHVAVLFGPDGKMVRIQHIGGL